VAFHCKAKPVAQLKHVVVVAVKQDAQFVPQAVVLVVTVATHVAVPVYPAPQAVQVRAFVEMVHAVQPAVKPVAVAVAAGEDTPVAQLTQLPAALTTYPSLHVREVAGVPTVHVTAAVSVHTAQRLVAATR
jgi:hypothetical protein